MDHPIFQNFKGYKGSRPADLWIDWIGGRFRREWITPFPGMEQHDALFPLPGEEYFEWIDLLEAVVKADDQFTMVEIGAGFGRWGIRAACAARQRGIKKLNIRLLEAEPQHAEWAREALALNDLTVSEAAVVEAVIANTDEPIPFIVNWEGLDAHNHYGQRISEPGIREGDELYFGKPVYRRGNESTIYVEPIKLENLLAELECVDLIDMDIQGTEEEVVTNAIDILARKVRRLHIGTHGAGIEAKIRSVLALSGWQSVWDFGSGEARRTPYGWVTFGDGVQTWVNRRLT